MSNKYLPEGSLISTPENREYISSYAGLERARIEGKILEGIVTKCDSNLMRLYVDLYGITGVIEREECLLEDEIKDIAIITRVGKAVSFKVMQLTRQNGEVRAILSRRASQRECMERYLMDLTPGDIIPAKITHFESFGAFLDIGCGIASLLSIDAVSISRISSPKERFSEREEINVIVKSIDYETGRIYVSTKELFGTWEENASQYEAGQTVFGIIRSIESYGIFVELAPNLAGLAELKENVTVGQSCAVYIKSIIPEKMKIKLVIIDTYDSLPPRDTKRYYKIDTAKTHHISYWRYSPNECNRIVETVFDERP